MSHLSPAQCGAAYGQCFDVPGVLAGTARVKFCGVFPSGNVGIKRAADPDAFGPLAIDAAQAEPLFAAIRQRFDARGRRVLPGASGKQST